VKATTDMPTATALYAYAKEYDTPEVWLLNPSSDEARDWMVITFDYFFLTVTAMRDIVI
jgi:hypothetical protein